MPCCLAFASVFTRSTTGHGVQSQRTQEQQRQLDSFCRTHRIPKALSVKLEQYFDHVLRRRVHQEDLLLVQQLSGTLRQQARLPPPLRCASSAAPCCSVYLPGSVLE